MFLEVHDLLLVTKEDQINRKQHSDCVHTAGGHDPEPFAELRPSSGLAEEPDEPSKVRVGHGRLRRDERLPRLVVHVHYAIMIVFIRHVMPSLPLTQGFPPLGIIRLLCACGAT